MYPVSNEFKEAVRSIEGRDFEVKVEIAGIEYTGSSLVEFTVEDALNSIDDLTTGEAVSSKLTLSIRTRNIFNDGDPANPYIRVLLADDSFSPWVPLGKFFISEMVNKLGLWNLTCYDALTTLLQPYWSDLIYPAKMADVMAEIAGQIDLEFADSVVVNHDHEIMYNTGELTYREVIRFIAGAHLCSVKMTREGKLAWVNFFPKEPASEITRRDYFKLDRTNSIRTITKVIVTNSIEGETVYIEKGEGTEYQTLRFECPYITQEMLDQLFPSLNGFTYVPYRMEYRCFPELETGDWVTFWQDESLPWMEMDVNWDAATVPWDGLVEHASIILSSTITFKGGGLRGKLGASTKSEQEKAYQFNGTLGQQIKRLNRDAVQETRNYNGVKITRQAGIEVLRDDGKVEVSMSATDGIRISSDVDDEGYLTDVFYIDPEGNLIVRSKNQVTFESLTEPGATVINGANLMTETIGADKIKTNELIVGDNIAMGSNAQISWGNVTSKPDIGQIALDKINTTYIDGNGVWTPNVYATNISTANGRITTAQIESLVVGNNVTMGPNATINWNNVTGNKPSQYTDSMALAAWVGSNYSTYISSSGIYTGTLAANRITAGTISASVSLTAATITSNSNINVTSNAFIGREIRFQGSGDKSIIFSSNGSISFSDSGSMWIGALSYVRIQNWDFWNSFTIVNGSVDFSNATVTGLDVTARFG